MIILAARWGYFFWYFFGRQIVLSMHKRKVKDNSPGDKVDDFKF